MRDVKRSGWFVVAAMGAALLWLWEGHRTTLPDAPPPSPAAAVEAPPSSAASAVTMERRAVPRADDATEARPAVPPPNGPSVSGRVVDVHGHPVEGAHVGAALDAAPDDSGVLSVLSGHDGRFALALDRGSYAVSAHRDDLGTSPPRQVHVEAAAVDVGDLPLVPSSLLEGRLTYPDGQPIAHLAVTLHREEGQLPAAGRVEAHLRTDEDGRIRLGVLAPGRYRLDLPTLMVPPAQQPHPTVVTGAPESTCVLDLHRIRAEVIGSPFLQATGWRQELGPQLTAARDGDGDWAALVEERAVTMSATALDELVPSGSWWWLRASADDGRDAQALVHAAPQRNETPTKLRLEPPASTATLRVRLRCLDGAAPTTVKLWSVRALSFGAPNLYRVEPSDHDGGQWRFRLPAGTFEVHVQADPSLQAQSPFPEIVRVVRMRAGTETVLEADLERGGRVALLVRRSDRPTGADPASYRVAIEAGAGEEPRPITRFITPVDSGGHRESMLGSTGQRCVCGTLLTPGQHELTVTADGYAPARVGCRIEPGAVTDVDLWLQPQ